MAHGSRETLVEELEALLRQRDQYSLALDAATDPQASVRLQRTLERLEDEIEGLREALAAMPGMEVQPPDWEDEPATAIFDPDVMPAPRPEGPSAVDLEETTDVMPTTAFEAEPDPTGEDPARPLYDLEEEMRRARQSGIAPSVRVPSLPVGRPRRDPTPAPVRPQSHAVPEPGAAEPLPAVDPTINVTPPHDSGFAVDPPTIAIRRVPPRVAGRPYPDPLGPVVLDALEPPTGENPREDDEPPSDPFALPGAGSGAAWAQQTPSDPWGQGSSATPIDDASPFGSTAVAPAAFDASSDLTPEAEWSAGSKIALALVVVGFLAVVGWVLTQ